MAALGLPLEGTPDYIPARQQATQYMQPDAFSVEFGYGQPVYPAMYPVAPGNLPEYLNTAPSAALQWEMPQVLLAPHVKERLPMPPTPQPCFCAQDVVCLLYQSYVCKCAAQDASLTWYSLLLTAHGLAYHC